MSYHAVLGPSGAHKWMACPGAIVLEHGLPDQSSDDANWGSAAHELAANLLEKGGNAHEHLGYEFVGWGVKCDQEMADTVQAYLDFVRNTAAGYELLDATVSCFIEQEVPIEHLTGEKDGRGTADCILLVKAADGTALLHVIDFKGGAGVVVQAEGNPQLQMYALGAHVLHCMEDITHVHMTIVQPRVGPPSEWSVPLVDLLAFGDEVKLAAERVENARATAAFGGDLAPYLNPGDKQCRFCRAKATCPALRAQVEKTIGAEISAITDDTLLEPEFKDDDGLSTAMGKLDLIEKWCKAVRAEVEARLVAGKPVPGYKLVEGRRGNRQWSDEAEAEAMLRKQFRLTVEEAYNLKLKSPPQIEKILENSPRRWKKVEALIVQSDGKPSVAPESDKRPAISVHVDESEITPLPPEDKEVNLDAIL